MKTTICDICGKPMDHTNQFNIDEGLCLKVKPVKTTVDRYLYGRIDINHGRIDICRNCMNEIFQWIKENS